MILFKKELLQTNKNLVLINNLAIIIGAVLFLNCSSLKKTSETNEIIILNKEIKVSESFSKGNKVVLVLNQNKYLTDFMKKSSKNGFSIIKSNSNIEREVFNSLFNNNSLLKFTEQLENNNLDLKAIKQGSNTEVRISNKKSNSTSSFLKNSSNYEIILSKPFISQNEKFALICFSRGFDDSKEGGISIYEKNNSTWIKIDTIDSWIE